MSRWTVPADDPRYEGDQHPAGPIERAVDKAVETVTGRCRWVCGDVECPESCRNFTDRHDQTGATLNPPPVAEPYRSAAPRDATTPPTTQGATRMPVIDWIRDYWDMFFAWLFDWGQDDPKYLSDGQAVNRLRARNIAAAVDAKLAEQRAAKSAPVAVEAAEQDVDTRPQPAPQDLDAIAASPPPPPRTSTRFRRPPPKLQLAAWSGHERDWCSCEGNAHDARCRFTVRSLNVSSSFPPPPSGGRGSASTEPAPPTQP